MRQRHSLAATVLAYPSICDVGIMPLMPMAYRDFIKTLPQIVIPLLPEPLQGIKVKQPWKWLVQFHYGEPRLHYEVSRPGGISGMEIGFHCESTSRELNRYLLDGLRQSLFEIKHTLGESVEAEMWDKGWTKIYEVYPEGELHQDYQQAVATRTAEFIVCLHPFIVDLRNQVAQIYR